MPGRGVAYALWERTESERVRLGWTKQRLAEAAGLPRSTVNDLRTNIRPPLPRIVHALADRPRAPSPLGVRGLDHPDWCSRTMCKVARHGGHYGRPHALERVTLTLWQAADEGSAPHVLLIDPWSQAAVPLPLAHVADVVEHLQGLVELAGSS